MKKEIFTYKLIKKNYKTKENLMKNKKIMMMMIKKK